MTTVLLLQTTVSSIKSHTLQCYADGKVAKWVVLVSGKSDTLLELVLFNSWMCFRITKNNIYTAIHFSTAQHIFWCVHPLKKKMPYYIFQYYLPELYVSFISKRAKGSISQNTTVPSFSRKLD